MISYSNVKFTSQKAPDKHVIFTLKCPWLKVVSADDWINPIVSIFGVELYDDLLVFD